MSDELALKTYMKSDGVLERFAMAVGQRQASGYISSVLLLVRNTEALQKCTVESVVTSALRAATLRLSVDPATKQAYLVPFAGKATLIVGWKGLYDMAVRTGKYRFINVAEVKAGYTINFDIITGLPKMEPEEGVEGGWVGSFELMTGYGKTIYMTYSDIEAHKKKFAKGYEKKDSAWQTNLKTMQRKTVLRALLQTWGYLDPDDKAALEAVENDEDVIDAAPIIEEPQIESGENKEAVEVLDDRNWTDTKLNWLVSAQLAIDVDDAAYMLSLSRLPDDTVKADLLLWAKHYRQQRDLDGSSDWIAANNATNIFNREMKGIK